MKNPNPVPENTADKLIVRGVHLALTPALRDYVADKTARLLNRSEEIVRLRIDLESDKTRDVTARFTAHGRIELSGPDLQATAETEDAYKSVDLLVDKLDELLRRRHSLRKDRRNHPHAVELDADLPKAGGR